MVCRDSLSTPESSTSPPPPSPNTALALLIAQATASAQQDLSESSPPASSPSSPPAMDPAATVQAIVSSLAGSAAPESASSATSSSPNGTNPSTTASSSGSAPHQCSMCSKSFATNKLLQNHQHMFHTEKAFICEICGKAFRFRSNLAEHRSVHTALKPYVCKFCGKSSRLKGNLTKHILKHHKLEQNAYIGKDDIIIKKGKKSVKDPAAVDFLQKSMIVLTSGGGQNAATGTTVSPGSADPPSRETTVEDDADASRSFFMSLGLDAGSMDLSGNSPDGSLNGAEQLLDASAADRHEAANDFDSDTSNASPSATVTVSATLNGGDTPIHLRSLRTQCAECGKHFRKESQLVTHMSLIHGYPPPGGSVTSSEGDHNEKGSEFGGSSAEQNGDSVPVQLELRQIKCMIGELRHSSNNARIEQLLTGLDARVGRLEKQLEMALNSIYTLVQLQTGTSTALNRFKDDAFDQLRSIGHLLSESSA
ncbi:hypothetical protein QR680_017444 [Steinernema hermaphroditum]|uniref:C2H2-type domain-containing protein n=1 Tax=Steinernema hermaphroditum TaxID=289476 RepID=A0AA39HF58_9BILA|nr:hypothetical protein QR680_017444 [Steinernema hermaphroditum]